MKLTNKLFALLVVVIIIPLIVGIFATYSIIKNSVEKMEFEKAINNMASVTCFLDSLKSNHGSNYITWTFWTDYYNAVVRKDSGWIRDNVISSAKQNTPHEVIIVLDNEGRIIEKTNSPRDWDNINSNNYFLFNKLNKNTNYASGLEYTANGLYIVSIVKLAKNGDLDFSSPYGYTIYARKVTEEMMVEAKRILNTDISIKFNDGTLSSTIKTNMDNNQSVKKLKIGSINLSSKIVDKTMIVQAEQTLIDSNNKLVGSILVESKGKAGVLALNKIFYNSILLILLVLLLSILTLTWIKKYIVNTIVSITDIIRKKDLSKLLKIKGKDEISILCDEFNKMIQDQREVIQSFIDSANLVSDTSQKIFSATKDLSISTQSQIDTMRDFAYTIEQTDEKIHSISGNVANLNLNFNSISLAVGEMGNSIQETSKDVEIAANYINEVSASIEQMDDSINSIASHAKDVENEAENTVVKAQEGNVAVSKSIKEMEGISKSVEKLSAAIKELGISAEKIGDIVDVIDDIAEQTNLLSLNAAIEAARAGEAGKGFAIVANSIRGLAEKSGDATKDISKIIKGIQHEVTNAIEITNDSTHRVNEGAKYITSTGLVFEEIFKAIYKTRDLVQEIASAIEEQEMGSKEIITVVEKMNDFIKQLSATSQEQAAGTEEIVKAIGRINYLVKDVSASIDERAKNSQEMVKLIQSVNQVSSEIFAANQSIFSSINNLANQAQELVAIVNQFKMM